MKQKRALTIATSAFLGLACSVLLLTFGASLAPTERAEAGLPRVAIPQLKPGEYAYVNDPGAYEDWPADLLFVRRQNGELDVWLVPRKDGTHAMPDYHWWRPGLACETFTPDFRSNTIACRDSDISPWFREAYVWSLDGKNVSGQVTDMVKVEGYVQLGDYVIVKRKFG